MAHACVTVRIEPDSVLSDHSFVDRQGQPRAWLDIGTGELAVYGAPDALRRLAAAMLAAADRADELAREQRGASASPGAGGAGEVVARS